tara:strand:- start:990 stop:1580 length:591 start_codon:yes stop_codon:yes gene_type:complete
MCLRKNKYIYIFLFLFFLTQKICVAEENQVKEVINHLNSLKFFSASFIQDDNETISEGKLFIGFERLRVEYKSPDKILIVLGKNKGMYYNYELNEDEFFDPKDTSAWFFYNIFNNTDFFYNSDIVSKDKYVVMKKKGLTADSKYTLTLFFEEQPLLLRKIKLEIDDTVLTLSIFNHKYNNDFDKNFFKLINPSFFN